MENPPDHASSKDIDRTRPIRVFLDGVEQRYVHEYSVSGGWVDVTPVNEHGNLEFDESSLKIKRLIGIVKAEWMD